MEDRVLACASDQNSILRAKKMNRHRYIGSTSYLVHIVWERIVYPIALSLNTCAVTDVPDKPIDDVW